MKTTAKIFLGERLRVLRGGLAQREMAANIGVPQKTYANWELGIRQPKLEDLAGLCAHFGVSSDWLLGLSDVRGGVKNLATNSPGSAVGDGAQVVTPATESAELQDIRKALAALMQRVDALAGR